MMTMTCNKPYAEGFIRRVPAEQVDLLWRESAEHVRQVQRMAARSRLATGATHEFNNLTNIIAGYSALLLDTLPPGDPAREWVLEIKRAGARAAALTRQLRLCNPFFTTQDPGKGKGLGLAMHAGFSQEGGGPGRTDSSPVSGTSKLFFPEGTDAPAPTPQPPGVERTPQDDAPSSLLAARPPPAPAKAP